MCLSFLAHFAQIKTVIGKESKSYAAEFNVNSEAQGKEDLDREPQKTQPDETKYYDSEYPIPTVIM